MREELLDIDRLSFHIILVVDIEARIGQFEGAIACSNIFELYKCFSYLTEFIRYHLGSKSNNMPLLHPSEDRDCDICLNTEREPFFKLQYGHMTSSLPL